LLLAIALLLSRALAQTQDETPDGALLTPPAATQSEPGAFPTDPVVGFPTDPTVPLATPSEPTPQPIPAPPLPVEPPQVNVPRPPMVPVQPQDQPQTDEPEVDQPQVGQPQVGQPPSRQAPNVETPIRPKPVKSAPAVIVAPKQAPAVKPVAKPTVTVKPAAKPAAKPKAKPAVARPKTTGKSMMVRSTAYNSLPGQTDKSPFKTATGARTRFGIVALSRDLLRSIPYGSRIVLEDMGSWSNGSGRGKYNAMLSKMIFVVEDTMHPRKKATVDVWFPARRQAIQWGARKLRIRVVQLGR
jgi:3D (Asp-Asp-Asp) domain-containing protein